MYVAGGLGFYLDQNAAVRTGLLPEEFLGRVEVLGNASLKGAVKALEDPAPSGTFRDYCRSVAKAGEVLDLASDPAFMDAFGENMIFPENS